MGTRDVVLHPSSLNPPTNRGGPGANRANTRRPDWVLLDFSAYVLERKRLDPTTATCKFRGDMELEVAFVVATPPNVSFFIVYCHGLEPSHYAVEPQIIATEDDLVLLRTIIGGRSGLWDHSAQDYFIYRAQGRPSLEHIPRPGRYLLRGGGDPVGLLKHNDGYFIASLGDDASAVYRGASKGQFEVCLFDSKDKVWTTRPVDLPRCKVPVRHETSTVLTIGGGRGTMAFVDLWHGILLYDVLANDPMPRYIPLPETTTFGTPDYSDDASNSRDIAVVKSHLKYLEMGFSATTGTPMVATYSIPVASCQEDTWHPDCMIDVSEIRDDKNLLSPEVQRMLKYDERMEQPEPTMKTLCTGHPTLSLDDEDTVYFMTKFKPMSRKACVIAVNTRLGTIQEVARFGAARTRGINFTYIRSRISSFLRLAPTVIRHAGFRKKTEGTKVGFGLCTPGF